MTEEKPKHIQYAEAFGTWLNRTTAILFFVLLTIKLLGVTSAVFVSWGLVFAPLFVRWSVLLVCIVIIGIAEFLESRHKR